MTRRLAPVAFVALTAVATLAARPLVAQPAASPAASPAAATGFRAEFLAQLDDVEKKLVSLAEAIPADKYGWRPAPGVRSISELFNHVGGGNYFLMTFVGVKPPMAMDPSMEKTVTEKAKVVAFLKDSFAHVRKSVQAMPDADLEKKVTMFGHDNTGRGVLLVTANHEHEHLGQAIAYARMAGVTPPWTAEREAKAAKKES